MSSSRQVQAAATRTCQVTASTASYRVSDRAGVVGFGGISMLSQRLLSGGCLCQEDIDRLPAGMFRRACRGLQHQGGQRAGGAVGDRDAEVEQRPPLQT